MEDFQQCCQAPFKSATNVKIYKDLEISVVMQYSRICIPKSAFMNHEYSPQ